MIVGFTGSRNGCNDTQKKLIKRILLQKKPTLVVHGGCIGADDNFDLIAWVLGYRRRCYPGAVSGIYRAIPVAPYEEKFPIRDPLQRNADIVGASDVLIACPDGPERLRSGTWSTIRLAKRLKKHHIVIYPDGSIVDEATMVFSGGKR